MYAVSEAYLASMAADLREMPSFRVTLHTADTAANSALALTFTPEPLQRGQDLNATNRESPRIPRATLEHDWLRADGRYTTSETEDYIGAGLSAGTASADGLYPYPLPDVIAVTSIGSEKPISFLMDASVAQVAITHTDGAVETVQLQPDSTGSTLLIDDSGEGTITVKILSSYYPHRRPRIYGIYAATVTTWDGNDIVEIALEDENDLACLEMPSRSVELTINNLDGKLDPQQEIVNPTFSKKATQAILSFVYDGETVPIGRLFLDTYTVDQKEICFSFDWAMLPLSDANHSLSRIGNYTVQDRIAEISDPEPEHLVIALKGAEENTAAKYGITINTDKVPISGMIIQNPYPIGSRAVCLQLLCNAMGLIMLPGRTEDITIQPLQSGWRRIAYEELLAEPEYSGQQAFDGGTINCYDLAQDMETTFDSVVVSTNAMTRIELDDPTSATNNVVQEIYDADGISIGYVICAAQGYMAYVYCEMVNPTQRWSQPSGEFTLPIRKRQKSTIDYGGVPRKKLDNPLIDSSLISSYWARMWQRLNGEPVVTIKHRGFPELDCGDMVRVQLRSGGEYVDARVVQNKWEFRSGVLSGSTKLRIIMGVG